VVSLKAKLETAPADAPISKLDELQFGHLRHLENLSMRYERDWRDMLGLVPMQEGCGTFRNQMAHSFRPS
jgi:hypothetical protein